MNKTLISILLFSCISLHVKAGGGEYAVSFIPANLMVNAHAVKRMEQISFEIVNPGEAILKRKYALTILNENGDKYSSFVASYDKLHEIRNIEGALFDASGKELKRLKNKQIVDFSGGDNNNLMDDNRVKAHNFFYKVYPYTVEYEVEIRYDGILFFPAWEPREDQHFSVQQSSISIVHAPSYEIRYKAFNYAGEPVKTAGEKGKEILTWQISNLPVMIDEYASPEWHEINTSVIFEPSVFSIEKYDGAMTSWKDFGKFIYTLNAGRDQLPENIRQAVHQIADTISNPREKIARLYEYMQKNTRYISIQLGIGGWQPFDAKYVATKAYGDCKALSNYMYSLLKEAGIKSLYTLIKAGKGAGKVIADFPSAHFNHAILCVPQQKDTVWLECTSQTMPAGYLGDFTCDRYALVVDENGGTLVRTPKYGMKENTEVRKVVASLDEESTLLVKAETNYGGIQQDLYHDLIHSLSKDKVKEFLHEQLDFATYDIRSFNYSETKSSLPAVQELLEIEVRNYATITGKRLFIIPNVMTRSHRKLSADSTRKYDIEFKYEYHDIDTVEIRLPAGYTAESIPKDVTINSKFGKYNSHIDLKGNIIYYYRNMEYFSGRFPAREYAELVSFYESIYKADRNKVVLVKNEEPKKGF
jgi:Domain of Unknown Function with PDB structure (DUF3857)